MQCPGCQHENRPLGKFCEECGTSLARPNQGGPPAASYADLQRELEHLTRALSESLEQQTATSEILRVISSSPTDVQPVLEAVAESAARLCEAPDVSIFLHEADHLRVAARHGPIPSDTSLPLSRASGVGEAVLAGRTVHVADMQTELDRFPISVQNARRLGFRTALNVPLIREGVAIGAISLRRAEARLFTERQVALLQTFADQGVIAIENVRLFTELEARNRELTNTLARQVATSEVLRAISNAHTDIQPVFEIIARSARRLCGAAYAQVQLSNGHSIHLAALDSANPEGDPAIRAVYPLHVGDGSAGGRAIQTRSVTEIPDLLDEGTYAFKAVWESSGLRSLLAIPMLRDGTPIGTIGVGRVEPGRFPQSQIDLLQTFADQAVIALENARLFKELQSRTEQLTRSVDQLTALGEVGRAVSSTLDLETVLTTIVSRAVQLSGLDGGAVFEYAEVTKEFTQRAQAETGGALAATRRGARIRKGEGVVGRTAITREPVQVADITVSGSYVGPNQQNLIDSGVRAILAVPMVREDRLIGCLGVSRNRPGEFPPETIELLRTFATQSALAIQNARLFHDIEDKSRQLEAASRHKSEFLANMSHELRTPLNAVIGFSEVLLQRMFGALNAKQDEYLKDIYASGQHLLSLINDILDLSKIEAGRMELTPAPFHLPSALENAVTLVKERASRHGIALQLDLDPQLGELVGDERKVKQVLLNLLSNAVKFTPEGGGISLKASRKDGLVEIAVTDTGVGIAPEDHAAVFEEFRQVGTADKKAEGTGLGLTLAKKFVELHGGRIWVESEPGRGSTFTFTLPVS
jgi:signal transduction histidine kinase